MPASHGISFRQGWHAAEVLLFGFQFFHVFSRVFFKLRFAALAAEFALLAFVGEDDGGSHFAELFTADEAGGERIGFGFGLGVGGDSILRFRGCHGCRGGGFLRAAAHASVRGRGGIMRATAHAFVLRAVSGIAGQNGGGAGGGEEKE